MCKLLVLFFFFSSRRRHTRFDCDWSSDVCSSDLEECLAQSGNDSALSVRGISMRPLPPITAAGSPIPACRQDRKSTRLNSSHSQISYAVFCLKKKKTKHT